MNDPMVTMVYPPEAQPGDEITLLGDNLAQGDRVQIWRAGDDAPEHMLGLRRVRFVSEQVLVCSLPQRLLAGPKEVVIVRDGVGYHSDAPLTLSPTIHGLVASEGNELTLTGQGFVPDSQLALGDTDLPSDHVTASRLSVTLPERAPQARPLPASGPRPAMDPARSVALDHGFRVARHGFSFPNRVQDQRASWGTFLETFGPTQVKLMNRLSSFMFLWAYYALYTSFFEGAGIFQASGLCSGLAAVAMERFYAPTPGDAPPLESIELELDDDLRKRLTVGMGHILGKRVLVHAYDQCKRGLDNVPVAIQALQASLAAPVEAENALMLWFLPSGRITERAFMEQLANAHAVVPCSMTATLNPPINRWHIPIYDVNMPGREDVWVEVIQRDDGWQWAHNIDRRFSSDRGMTLATMPLAYFQEPAEFPFSGPFGLTKFIFDMLW